MTSFSGLIPLVTNGLIVRISRNLFENNHQRHVFHSLLFIFCLQIITKNAIVFRDTYLQRHVYYQRVASQFACSELAGCD